MTSKKVLILITILMTICVASLIALMRGTSVDDPVVRITVGGTIVQEIALHSNALPKTMEIHGKNGIESVVTIEDGRVRVDEANCPDQICVHQGWIVDDTVPIVCLPGEVIVEILGGASSGLDGQTG